MADTGEGQSQQAPNGNLGPSISTPENKQSAMTNDASPREGSSDGEGERTTRERLKKTSIAGMAQQATHVNDVTKGDLAPAGSSEGDVDHNGTRGRPAKKRSFEDITKGDGETEDHTLGAADSDQPNPKSGHHKRMRSRDVAAGDSTAATLPVTRQMAEPVREESDSADIQDAENPNISIDAPQDDASNPPSSLSQGSESTNLVQEPSAASAAFANASSTSPFGTVKSPTNPSVPDVTSEPTPTSATAFASSGLSAFASSENSPFGNAAKSIGGFGTSSGGGFGGASKGFGGGSSFASKQSNGGFGSSSGFGAAKGFGASSTFGSATGFAAAKPIGSSISSFATPSSSGGGGGGGFGPGKPLGSSKEKDVDDEERSDDEDDEDEEDQRDEDEDQDGRFVAQDVETGEEEEQTIFVCRAKLYHFEKEWKERGVGTIKINMKEEMLEVAEAVGKDADEEAGPQNGSADFVRRGRLIMRTDGVHRVILNTPIFKNMLIGQSDGTEPVGKTMHLTGLEDGKPRAFQIKIGKEDVIKDFYWKVVDLRSEAKA